MSKSDTGTSVRLGMFLDQSLSTCIKAHEVEEWLQCGSRTKTWVYLILWGLNLPTW